MPKKLLKYTDMDSIVGPLTLVATDKGLCLLLFGNYEETKGKINIWKTKMNVEGSLEEDAEYFTKIKHELYEYFHRDREEFSTPLDLYGTTFQKKVWRALQAIPYGTTNSYKELAQAIQAPKAVRAVGAANNRNPLSIIIPCHRVIGSNGAMVGYGGGIEKKETLLQLESKQIGTWEQERA